MTWLLDDMVGWLVFVSCFLLLCSLRIPSLHTLHLEIVGITTFGCITIIWWLISFLRQLNKFVVTAMTSTLHSYATSSKLSNPINDFQV